MSDAACAARPRVTGGAPCGRIAWDQRLRAPAERVSPPRRAWVATQARCRLGHLLGAPPPCGGMDCNAAAGKRAVFSGPRGRKDGEDTGEQKTPQTGAFGKKKSPGSDLLSHGKTRSNIGAGGFHCRVRNGFGWDTSAMTARRKYIRIIERREIRHSIH